MAKTTVVEEIHVLVEPRRIGDLGAVSVSDRLLEPDEAKRLKEYRRRCASIVEDVRRHVDDVGDVRVEEVVEEVCEHCGSLWTEGDSPHNGGCCHEDAEAMEEGGET